MTVRPLCTFPAEAYVPVDGSPSKTILFVSNPTEVSAAPGIVQTHL